MEPIHIVPASDVASVANIPTFAPARTVSKKKYMEIKQAYEHELPPDIAEKALDILCKVLVLDPNMSTYSKEKNEKHKVWIRTKMQEQGVTSYSISGRQRQYDIFKNNKLV